MRAPRRPTPGMGNFFSRRAIWGRRSPFPAGLLDGSSSISSTTTVVRAALIGKAKKSPHVLRCPVPHQKRAKKGPHALRCPVFYQKYRQNSGAIISTFF